MLTRHQKFLIFLILCLVPERCNARFLEEFNLDNETTPYSQTDIQGTTESTFHIDETTEVITTNGTTRGTPIPTFPTIPSPTQSCPNGQVCVADWGFALIIIGVCAFGIVAGALITLCVRSKRFRSQLDSFKTYLHGTKADEDSLNDDVTRKRENVEGTENAVMDMGNSPRESYTPLKPKENRQTTAEFYQDIIEDGDPETGDIVIQDNTKNQLNCTPSLDAQDTKPMSDDDLPVYLEVLSDDGTPAKTPELPPKKKISKKNKSDDEKLDRKTDDDVESDRPRNISIKGHHAPNKPPKSKAMYDAGSDIKKCSPDFDPLPNDVYLDMRTDPPPKPGKAPDSNSNVRHTYQNYGFADQPKASSEQQNTQEASSDGEVYIEVLQEPNEPSKPEVVVMEDDGEIYVNADLE